MEIFTLPSQWRALGRRLSRRGRRGWVWLRRHGRLLRVTGALLAVLGLLNFAVVVGEELAGAQQGESTGVGISLDDLSDYPTHLTVDRFLVELSNLTATEDYQVTVSSNSARVAIGGCGTSSQQITVTGVASRELAFLVYACAVGEATVTAEVRRTGASSPEASISRTISVEALPEEVIEASGQRRRIGAQARSGVARAGTPGIVPSISFYDVRAREFKVRWGTPSDGGRSLTGFGLLIWIAPHHPPYSSAHVVGPSARSHHFTGMDPNTTYSFRIHACNGRDSCGYWTNPPKTVKTPRETGPPPTPTPRPTPTPTPETKPVPTPGPPSVSVSLIDAQKLPKALAAGTAGWVLGQAIATVTEESSGTAGYQYRLVVPASTGLQVNAANSRDCDWRVTSPTTTVNLRSAWVAPGKGIRLLRCGLGSAAAASVTVQGRLGGNGAPVTVHTLTITVPQAVHHADEQVAYYICGTTASGITAVADGDCAGFFPLTGMPAGHAVSADTVDEATYTTAADAWTAAKVGAGVSRVTSKNAADVVIRGSWAADKNGGKCPTSVACAGLPAPGRHLGAATIWIEEPPWLPHPKTGAGVKWSWTSDFKLANLSVSSAGPYFEYLPAVMMHEFGHALGLDDSDIPNIMMSSAAFELLRLTPTDTSAAKAIYQHHAPH